MIKYGTQNVCPKCGGYMFLANVVQTGNTKEEVHQCASCGHTAKTRQELSSGFATAETPSTPESDSPSS